MVREDKVKVVKDLERLFKSANALVLAEYRGLTVTQQTKLRRELKNAGASFNVVKMSLAKRAAENIGLDSLNDYFSGPTGIAKALFTFCLAGVHLAMVLFTVCLVA